MIDAGARPAAAGRPEDVPHALDGTPSDPEAADAPGAAGDLTGAGATPDTTDAPVTPDSRSPVAASVVGRPSMHAYPTFWHMLFGVLWGVCTMVVFIEPAPPRGRGVTVGLLLAMLAVYLLVGLPTLRTTSRRLAAVYLPLVWGCVIAIEYLDNGAETWILYFVLFPHTWMLLPTAGAVAVSAAALSGVAVARYAQADGSAAAIQSLVVSTSIAVGLSLTLGILVRHLLQQAQRRQVALDELRCTQAALVTSERQRGIQDERERLSRDIHDTLAQGFTSVITLVRAADAALARDDIETARERLALLESTAVDSLSESRLIIADMTPSHLQARTLVEALERLCASLRRESAIAARLEVHGEPRQLSGNLEIVLLRAAQEALSNVRQHSRAGEAVVTLSYADAQVVMLDIVDDGVGLDLACSASGFGLDGIRARAVEVGGGAIITNKTGAGARVHVEVPR